MRVFLEEQRVFGKARHLATFHSEYIYWRTQCRSRRKNMFTKRRTSTAELPSLFCFLKSARTIHCVFLSCHAVMWVMPTLVSIEQRLFLVFCVSHLLQYIHFSNACKNRIYELRVQSMNTTRLKVVHQNVVISGLGPILRSTSTHFRQTLPLSMLNKGTRPEAPSKFPASWSTLTGAMKVKILHHAGSSDTNSSFEMPQSVRSHVAIYGEDSGARKGQGFVLS